MKQAIIILLLVSIPTFLFAQQDLLSTLEQQQPPDTDYTIQTFNGTRIINGHSVETKGKGALEFIFSHRFGRINTGSFNFWGLDDAFVRLGLEYGLSDKLGFGIGRTSVDKTFDSYIRYKVFSQSKGTVNFPVTITTIAAGYIQTTPQAKNNPQVSMSDRLAYSLGILIARKFNSNLSLQISPLFVHRNTVDPAISNNDDFAIGLGGRYKFTRSMSLLAEYYYHLNRQSTSPTFDAAGFGLDIETGGHNFQLIFTNTLGMFDRAMATETLDDFFSGDIRFGFNITRTFQLVHQQ